VGAGSDHIDFARGIVLPIAPFFGSIGVAPPTLIGRISSRPPGWHGGNIDNKDLIAGSTLYLPVHVPGRCCRLATDMRDKGTAR
jgi:acetamidase/formamidase